MRRWVSAACWIVLAASALLALWCRPSPAAHAQEDPAPRTTQTASQIAESLGRVYEDGLYQRSLPGRPTPIASDGSGESIGLELSQAPDASGGPATLNAPGLALFAGLGTLLFYGLLTAVAAVFLWWCISQWIGSQGDVSLPGESRERDRQLGDDSGPRLRPRAAARADALGHAEAGRFLEAAHILLLDGLARSVAGGLPLEVAMTSREFLHTVPADSDRRDALTVLVATVERGLFAGRPLDRPQFDASLASFDRIVAAGPIRLEATRSGRASS